MSKSGSRQSDPRKRSRWRFLGRDARQAAGVRARFTRTRRRRIARGAGLPSRKPSRSWALCSSAANRDAATFNFEGNHAGTACVPTSGKSRRRCDNECTGRSLKPGNGLRKSSPGISPSMPCRPIARRLLHFTTTSLSSGTVNYVGAAREQTGLGADGETGQ